MIEKDIQGLGQAVLCGCQCPVVIEYFQIIKFCQHQTAFNITNVTHNVDYINSFHTELATYCQYL